MSRIAGQEHADWSAQWIATIGHPHMIERGERAEDMKYCYWLISEYAIESNAVISTLSTIFNRINHPLLHSQKNTFKNPLLNLVEFQFVYLLS
jgi:hypothetical protein